MASVPPVALTPPEPCVPPEPPPTLRVPPVAAAPPVAGVPPVALTPPELCVPPELPPTLRVPPVFSAPPVLVLPGVAEVPPTLVAVSPPVEEAFPPVVMPAAPPLAATEPPLELLFEELPLQAQSRESTSSSAARTVNRFVMVWPKLNEGTLDWRFCEAFSRDWAWNAVGVNHYVRQVGNGASGAIAPERWFLWTSRIASFRILGSSRRGKQSVRCGAQASCHSLCRRCRPRAANPHPGFPLRDATAGRACQWNCARAASQLSSISY